MAKPRIRPHHRAPALLAGVVLLLATVGCSKTTTPRAVDTTTSTSGAAAPTTAVNGFTPAPLDWSRCDGGFECATLAVPLDYADPTGPTIELALSRQIAGDRSERVGSLLMNPGGPGASGIDLVQAGATTDTLAESFDLVSWDPRGIGQSSPLECETDFDSVAFRELDSDPDTPEEAAALDAGGAELATLCQGSDADLLKHLTTENTARDLETIRVALGDEPLNYLGFSYGTQIGQEYAALFPDKVRSMVLDGVVDPSISIQAMLEGQAITIENTFSAGTLATYDQLLAQVETTPLTGPGGTEIGPGMVTLAAITASYSPQGDQALSQALALALTGDATYVEQLALGYAGSGSFAAYIGTVCTDSPFEPGPAPWAAFAAELEATAPRFGAAVANELVACGHWPVAPREQQGLVTTTGLPPVLVIGNTGDAATPYVNAQKVAAAMPGAVLLTLDGAGHTAYGKNACIDDAVDTYLIDLVTPPPGTVC